MSVDYLRLSITDRCNLRCSYCMPPQGVIVRAPAEILSYEELAMVARVAATCGVSKIRVTGGEPLVRRDCADFVGMLSRTSGIGDVSLTTNGILLPGYAAELRRQGLTRVNISLDSLDPRRYAQITRGGCLDQALAGLDSALAAGFRPVKLNVLLLEGIEEELDAFVELTRGRPIHVRFIEFMPLDRSLGGEADGRRLVPAPVVLERLRTRHVLVPDPGPYGNGPARYWRVQGGLGSIGFVAGVSGHFCGGCTRLRLTADGRLKTCLFSGDELDIRPYVSNPDTLRGVIQAAMAGKRFDRCQETSANRRAMSEIGG